MSPETPFSRFQFRHGRGAAKLLPGDSQSDEKDWLNVEAISHVKRKLLEKQKEGKEEREMRRIGSSKFTKGIHGCAEGEE